MADLHHTTEELETKRELEKLREELEWRRELEEVEQAQEKAYNACIKDAVNHEKNKSVDFLCDFYNLQIVPRVKSDAPFPTLLKKLKSTSKALNRRELGRVKRFLRKNIQKGAISPFDDFIEKPEWLHELELRELSEWLTDNEWETWHKSAGFSEFIAHYVMVCRTTADLLVNRYHAESKEWLERLADQFDPPYRRNRLKPHPIEYVKPKWIAVRPYPPKNIETDSDGYYDLNRIALRWDYRTRGSKGWCELDNIKFLGEAILNGIYYFLEDNTQIFRCTLEDCDKIARFPTNGRGGRNKRYCSRNCMQKASNRRNEKK